MIIWVGWFLSDKKNLIINYFTRKGDGICFSFLLHSRLYCNKKGQFWLNVNQIVSYFQLVYRFDDEKWFDKWDMNRLLCNRFVLNTLSSKYIFWLILYFCFKRIIKRLKCHKNFMICPKPIFNYLFLLRWLRLITVENFANFLKLN